MPLLFVPPTINKYYVLDLAPGRSMVEYLVASGQQVVRRCRGAIPDEAQSHFDLDTYADAVIEARQAVADVTGQQPCTSTRRARAGSSAPGRSATSPPRTSSATSRA